MKTRLTEDQEQAKLSAWMSKEGIKHFAIPNGGMRNMIEAVKLKRCGVMPGVPDIMVPIPSGSYHGLFLELKRIKGGRVSQSQLHWLTLLRDFGYYADIAYGFDEARDIIIKYLALMPRAA